MSKTFTARPALASRGRGRGTQTRQGHTVNSNQSGGINTGPGARPRVSNPQIPPVIGRGTMAGRGQTDVQTEPQAGDEPAIEQRMTYQGGYSMITPNQTKRQEITQAAQRETQAYQEHKAQNTPKSFSYVGTAGGGQVTQAEARQKTIQESPTKTKKLLKNQERKSYFKQKEEEELQKKKEEQRRKAIQNENRKKETERAAEHKWDNQKKMTNEAFLRRMESQNKRATGARGVASTQPTQTTSSSASPERLQPAGAMGTTSPVTMETNQYSDFEEPSSAENGRVNALAAIFPQYPKTELLEILKQVDFSLDAAVSILQD